MKKVTEVKFDGPIVTAKGREVTAQQIGEDCEILNTHGGSSVAKKGDYLVRTEDGNHYVVPRKAFEALMDIEKPAEANAEEVDKKSTDGSEEETPVVETPVVEDPMPGVEEGPAPQTDEVNDRG